MLNVYFESSSATDNTSTNLTKQYNKMSQTTSPFRRRAGHLSVLIKGFAAARDIMQKDGSMGKALEIVNELNALYKTYWKSNDCAMDAKEGRSRAQNLFDPFLLCEKLHD